MTLVCCCAAWPQCSEHNPAAERQDGAVPFERVRDIIGQPLPGVIAGRFVVARNGDTFELWEVIGEAPLTLERVATGCESAADARTLAGVVAEAGE